jgi:hypothetical protein
VKVIIAALRESDEDVNTRANEPPASTGQKSSQDQKRDEAKPKGK